MKRLRLRHLLLACGLLPALVFAQATLPSKKVVFTSNQRLSESDIRELKQAAPSLDLVFPARDDLIKELADAEAVIGGLNREQFLAAKKLKWMQITSAGVENYLSIPEIKNSQVTMTTPSLCCSHSPVDWMSRSRIATPRPGRPLRNTARRSSCTARPRSSSASAASACKSPSARRHLA